MPGGAVVDAAEMCVSPQLFDEAQASVRGLLQQGKPASSLVHGACDAGHTDSFPRFISTKAYTDLALSRRQHVCVRATVAVAVAMPVVWQAANQLIGQKFLQEVTSKPLFASDA